MILKEKLVIVIMLIVIMKAVTQWQSLQWRQYECDGVSNHQAHECLLNRLFRRRSKKILSKLRVTGLCKGNSSVTGEFPAQRASKAENVSIWWRHHAVTLLIINKTTHGVKDIALVVPTQPESESEDQTKWPVFGIYESTSFRENLCLFDKVWLKVKFGVKSTGDLI